MANAVSDYIPLRRRCAFHKKKNPPIAAGSKFREEPPTSATRACVVCCNSHPRYPCQYGGRAAGLPESGEWFWERGLLRVCAVQRRRFPVGASPTRQSLQPEAIGAVMKVTKWLKPSISVSQIGDGASVQAATRVNAEQSSKRTTRRSTRQPYRGRLIRLDEMSESIRSDAAGHPPRLAAEMSLSSGGNRPHRESALAWLAVRRHAQLGERFVG
jgi:hypothetical protein